MVTAVATVEELERQAARRLDPALYAFVAAGAGDEAALAANREAFARRVLRPRLGDHGAQRSTATTVLGREVALPVLIAPVGYQTLLDPDGELATARAAARAGTVMCVSMISEASPAEIAANAPDARLWLQLYCLHDRGLTDHLIDQAAAAGFEALVVTVDGPVIGRRERALRAGFVPPGALEIRATAGGPGRPGPASAAELAGLLDPGVGWSDVERMAARGLPLVLKGILTAEDAHRAREVGAAAIVVSNHGGRQLESAPASLEALPEVAASAGEEVEVLLDGGVRSGRDVLIALALGARAVLVGRAAIWGLAAGGEDGVAGVLELLAEELDAALAACGCRAPRQATPALVGSRR